MSVINNISVPVFCNFNKTDYSLTKFIKIVLKTFENCCPLCDKKHPVCIHAIVTRLYRRDFEKTEVISVLRLICYPNLTLRRNSNSPIQYTLTILPDFLIPYSNIPVDAVFKAIIRYLNGKYMNLFEIAITMHCSSPHSFKLYYNRFIDLLQTWIMFMIRLIIELGGQETQPAIKEIEAKHDTPQKGWYFFNRKVRAYFILYSSYSNTHIIVEEHYYNYIHVLLCKNKMGLGP